ncbi:MAG: GNAT family N-acetyltransferase [Nitrospiraceae bacterium]|nr:GNAT family N-acetyltransferase [Nitrospiraceae bacterium]
MYFKRAVTNEELYDVYRLRYRVYCIERGYEDPEDHPYGIETDDYDLHSIHIIGYVKGTAVGTARLILPNPAGFPVEKHCNINLRDLCTDRNRTAEISRLAVSCNAIKPENICKSLVTLGLIRELCSIINQMDIRYVASAMTRSLERMLAKSGIHFTQAGAPVEYHGIRIPYYTAVSEITQNLLNSRKDIFDLLNLSALRMDKEATGTSVGV